MGTHGQTAQADSRPPPVVVLRHNGEPENIQDDMREESVPAPAAQIEQEQSVSVTPEAGTKKEEENQPEPARKETPFPFPTNDGGKRRLGVNSNRSPLRLRAG